MHPQIGGLDHRLRLLWHGRRSAAGLAVDQHAGIGVLGRLEDLARGAGFDHVAFFHDHNVVGHGADHVEVVGDQQHGHVPLALLLAQQFEDLRLNGHVEGGRRFIGDQQVGGIGQRHGDHHPLALPATELVRVGPRLPPGVGEPDVGQQIGHLLPRAAPVDPLVGDQNFCHLPVDPLDRVEGDLWLLKDHRDFVAANSAQRLGRRLEQVLPLPQDFAVRAVAGHGVGQQLQHRHGRNRLARAGLTDQRRGPARFDRKCDILRADETTIGGIEEDVEAPHLQQAHGLVSAAVDCAAAASSAVSPGWTAPACFLGRRMRIALRGSMALRTPSPMKTISMVIPPSPTKIG